MAVGLILILVFGITILVGFLLAAPVSDSPIPYTIPGGGGF